MINFLKETNGWFKHVNSKDDANCFTHKLFVYGDYCGSSVERANVACLLENKELCERLGIYELTEAYSTTSLIFPIAALDDGELKEIFENLDKYPLLDDQALSDIEMEMEQEDWNCFGLSDFKRYLCNHFDHEMIDRLSDDTLSEVYQSVSQKTNYNIWTNETGTSGYFNFDSFGGLYERAVPLLKLEIDKILKNEV